jgi:hypothetical protein
MVKPCHRQRPMEVASRTAALSTSIGTSQHGRPIGQARAIGSSVLCEASYCRASTVSSIQTRTLSPVVLFGDDPDAGSPTTTLLRLLHPLSGEVWQSSPQRDKVSTLEFQKPHLVAQSVVATGGVYKGQGRNRLSVLS